MVSAVFFELDGLSEDIVRAHVRYLDSKFLWLSTNDVRANEHLKQSELIELCEGVQAAYNDDYPITSMYAIRGSLVSLFWMGGSRLIEKRETIALLDYYRAFNRDLVRTLASGKCCISSPWLLPLFSVDHVERDRIIHSRQQTRQSFTIALHKGPVDCARCSSRLDYGRDLIFYNSMDTDPIKMKENWCKDCAMRMIEDSSFPWRP